MLFWPHLFRQFSLVSGFVSHCSLLFLAVFVCCEQLPFTLWIWKFRISSDMPELLRIPAEKETWGSDQRQVHRGVCLFSWVHRVEVPLDLLTMSQLMSLFPPRVLEVTVKLHSFSFYIIKYKFSKFSKWWFNNRKPFITYLLHKDKKTVWNVLYFQFAMGKMSFYI